MNTILDICKRSLYMNIFIVAIPVISYMIHNGSSATVAWYGIYCYPYVFLGRIYRLNQVHLELEINGLTALYMFCGGPLFSLLPIN